MSRILEARTRAGLQQNDLAAAIGRSVYAMDRIEQGLAAITPAEETLILRVIARLAAFESAMVRRREEFIADRSLKLPPVPARSASAVQ